MNLGEQAIDQDGKVFRMRVLRAAIVPALLIAALQPVQAQANATAPRLPSAAEARAVCRMVAARGPSIEALLIDNGVLDANNDGVPDDVSVALRDGTMHGQDLQFRPHGAAKDSKPVEVDSKDFQPGDYFPFGASWLPYGGKIYTLYFDGEALRYPSYLGFIDAGNVEHLLCDFSSKDDETLRAVAPDAGGLCGAVAQKKVNYTPVDDAAGTDLETGRWMTRAAGRVTVDFANRGSPATLAYLAFESGAGRGCVFDYYDAMDGDKLATSGDAHATLMKLQEVKLSKEDADVYTDGRCDGREPRWFVRGGATYLDMAGGPDRYGDVPFHEVRRLRAGKVETLCRASFAVSWQVKSMGPEFK